LTYGVASGVFGGTAPVIAAALTRSSGSARSAAWYATVVAALAIVCVLAAPETVDRPLDRDH
jgi:hypothetical protein